MSVNVSLVAETSLGRLECADALSWLAALPEESVDLVVADPPYNLGKTDWDDFESDAAYLSFSCDWIGLARRALKPFGSLYVMGFSETLPDLKAAVAREWQGCRWLGWCY